MKRFLILVLIFAAVFAFASCSKKKSHDYEERVSKKITAEEGGTVEFGSRGHRILMVRKRGGECSELF